MLRASGVIGRRVSLKLILLRWGVGSSPTLPTMKKRRVHISEENIFDCMENKEEIPKLIDTLLKKWKNLDFSTRLYFDKRRLKFGKGTIQFIKASKPKQ